MTEMTHVFVGTATALALTANTPESIVTALIGGAVGGIISDLEIWSTPQSRRSQFMVAGLVVILLMIDFLLKGSIWHYNQSKQSTAATLGIITFCALAVLGLFKKNIRHSLLSLLVSSISIFFFCAPILPSFIVGFIAHLALDILNQSPVFIFYPHRRGINLNLCAPDRLINKLFLMLGILGTLYFLILY